MVYFEKKKIFYSQLKTVTGDVERDTLITALGVVEAREGERRGWDQKPQLWTAHLHHIDSGTMELRPIPQALWRTGCDNPVDDLMTTAIRLKYPPARGATRLAFADSPDGVAAVVFMSEMWAADPDVMTEDLRQRHDSGERVIRSLPQRVEVRSITANDINGNGYVLARMRGEPLSEHVVLQTREQMWPAAGEDGPGRLMTALYCLAYAARVAGWPWR